MAPAPVRAKALNCPNCGGSIQLRGFAHSLTAVCGNCLSVLDASNPTLKVIQKISAKQRRVPEIPLGSRGKFDGTLYEVIGFQTRAITVDGIAYEWDEYVIFNPFKGFRYLTVYRGHWNIVKPLRVLPVLSAGTRPVAELDGRKFKHFQRAEAATTFVLGEFPWRVKVGERVTADDYTDPPYLLSSETTGNEVTWSLGEYTSGEQIFQAFGLKEKPREAQGIYVNQPNPRAGDPQAAWRLCGLLLLGLLVLGLAINIIARRDRVLNERHHFYPAQTGEQSFVTPIFQLKGRVSNVVVETRTDASNNWMYINYALINTDTGRGYDFGREISYYRDSDGSEGSQNDSVTVPSVPPGNYYLRVEPEGDAKNPPIEYDIIVRRDVPAVSYLVLGALALLVPPILIGWRKFKFEYSRWQESDYASTTSGSGSDD